LKLLSGDRTPAMVLQLLSIEVFKFYSPDASDLIYEYKITIGV